MYIFTGMLAIKPSYLYKPHCIYIFGHEFLKTGILHTNVRMYLMLSTLAAQLSWKTRFKVSPRSYNSVTMPQTVVLSASSFSENQQKTAQYGILLIE